ncbi:hypothetical protein BDV95DRAFT_44857 [Massariosphaeria phaeospora]|uniref:Secreted protein n=1 Tax=Massariosphaeria phaeospora TaxID=100035 RepID=A0A7C8MKN0_9PLEO|nr:hypothetical protein BDV95DRAFT_44857 [Massariosphaeria phaeospora]
MLIFQALVFLTSISHLALCRPKKVRLVVSAFRVLVCPQTRIEEAMRTYRCSDDLAGYRRPSAYPRHHTTQDGAAFQDVP